MLAQDDRLIQVFGCYSYKQSYLKHSAWKTHAEHFHFLRFFSTPRDTSPAPDRISPAT